MAEQDTQPAIAETTLYGVAHIETGGVNVIRYRNRDEAVRHLRDCREDYADCYLVSAVVRWEPV